MTPQDIGLVRNTWQIVKPNMFAVAEIFYRRLFELDPDLKALFRGDMQEQGRRLMTVINYCVDNLDNLGAVVPRVETLGRRHVDYGVQDEHYDTVGTALLWTLSEGLGDEFTDEVQAAWLKTYTLLADTMRNAAAQQAA